MSIRTRLLFGLSMVLALILSQAFIGMSQVNRLSRISTQIATRAMKRVEHVSSIASSLAQHRGDEVGYILSQDDAVATRYAEGMNARWQDVHLHLQQYEWLIDDPARMLEYRSVVAEFKGYESYRRQLAALHAAGQRAEAQAAFAEFQGQFDRVTSQLVHLRQKEFDDSLALAASASQLATRSRYLLVVALAVSVAVVVLGWYIWRSMSQGFGRLLEGTRRVSQGDLAARVAHTSGDEFGELAGSFNTMIDTLGKSREENQRLAQEALQMREERVRLLQDSLVKVVKAQEEERRRVALELHDQTGQALTALRLGLARIEREATSHEARDQAASLLALADETVEEVRNLALDLRPAALDELGLVPGLRGYVREFSRRIGTPIDLSISSLDKRLSPEVEIALFRAVQEGLTNVAKHSRATQAWVRVSAVGADTLEAEVEDNGVGFNVEEVGADLGRRSLGLFGIRERVGLLRGSLTIQSQPGKGTRLRITVPLANGALPPPEK